MNGDKQSEEELGLNFCQTLMEIVQQKSIFIFNIKLYKMCCRGCSTVDRAFASDTRRPKFESSPWQNIIINIGFNCYKDKIKE